MTDIVLGRVETKEIPARLAKCKVFRNELNEILFNILDLYTVCYLLFNTAVMVVSLHSVLKDKG